MRIDGESIVIEAKTSDALLLGMRKIRTALYNTFVLEQETPAAPVITTALCASLSGTVNMAEAPFSVLTQNIKNSDMDDGGTIEERAIRFDKLIAEFQPDVINTQESNNKKWQAAYETMLFDVYDRYPANGELSTRPNTILYRRDRFELQDAGTFYLSDTPDVPSSLPETKHVRMCTWVLLKDRITGDTVIVCNTHIDNSADEVRVRQTKILVEQLKDEIAEYPLCVTGDFNGNYLSDIYLAAAEALNDPHLNKDINFSEYAYTWNTVNKSYQRRIDFCFHNDLLKPVYYRILTDGYGGVISDHYGVLTEFTS
jgi:endonuclease/exonuclease/phosphatase family metal-dependent hydrolase